MRTADRFLAEQWVFPLGIDENRGFLHTTKDYIRTGPVLVADNVAHYVNERNPAVCLENYPSLAPPWPSFWIEYPSSSGRQRRGVLVLDTTEHRDAAVEDVLPEDGHHIEQLAAGAKRHALLVPGVEEDDVRWIVTFALFIEQDKNVWGPVGIFSLALDESGQVLGNRWSLAPVTLLNRRWEEWKTLPTRPDGEDVPVPSEEDIPHLTDGEREALIERLDRRREELTGYTELLRHRIESVETLMPVSKHLERLGADDADHMWLLRAMAPALQAVAFLHCKNVVTEIVEPPAKVQAKRARSGKAALVRYHTLRLDVPRRSGGTHGAGGSMGSPALHIVAGHFAHYGACCSNHEPHGLLFGRLGGVYWVPSHVRGDRSSGIVKTDFEVTAVPS